MVKFSFVDKNFRIVVFEGTPFEILNQWAGHSFPCDNLEGIELIKLIQKLCYFRFREIFPIDELKSIDEISLDVLNWLVDRNELRSLDYASDGNVVQSQLP